MGGELRGLEERASPWLEIWEGSGECVRLCVCVHTRMPVRVSVSECLEKLCCVPTGGLVTWPWGPFGILSSLCSPVTMATGNNSKGTFKKLITPVFKGGAPPWCAGLASHGGASLGWEGWGGEVDKAGSPPQLPGA